LAGIFCVIIIIIAIIVECFNTDVNKNFVKSWDAAVKFDFGGFI